MKTMKTGMTIFGAMVGALKIWKAAEVMSSENKSPRCLFAVQILSPGGTVRWSPHILLYGPDAHATRAARLQAIEIRLLLTSAWNPFGQWA